MSKSNKKPLAIIKSVPPKDDFAEIGGQLYMFYDYRPWLKKDGTKSNVLTWVASCKKCQGIFFETSGMKIYSLNKYCPLHRRRRQRKKGAVKKRAEYLLWYFDFIFSPR